MTSHLRTSKTPKIILTEIRMLSTAFNGCFFLVEGADDHRFWKRHLSSQTVSLVDCEGKEHLLGAVNQISQSNFPPVAGVYDPDFDRLQGRIHFPDLLAPTDENDLELTLIVSEALNSLLHEYGDSSKIADFEATHQISVLQHLEQTSRQFGQLRFLNAQLKHQVDFANLSPYRFVSSDSWHLDKTSLVSEYAKLSQLSVNDVEGLIQRHCPQTPNWSMSQGHDTISILRAGLRCRIGKTQISEKDVLRVLRIAFSRELLQKSQMYRALRVIESRQPVALFQ